MQQKQHIKIGLIISAILIVLKVAIQLANLQFVEWATLGFYALLIGCIAASVLYFSKANDNKQFSNLFSLGFKTTAVVACILFLFSVLFVYVLFPNFTTQLFALKAKELLANNSNNNNFIVPNEVPPMAKKIIAITHIAGTLLGTMFLGIVGSVIGAVIATQKNK
jgi:hypothetical protein